MKRIMGLLMVLLFALALSGCNEDPENVQLKIMIPLGSPALSQTYMEYTHPNIGDNVSYEIEVVSGTDPLVAAFGSGTDKAQLQEIAVEAGVFPSGTKTTLKNKLIKEYENRTQGRYGASTQSKPIVDPKSKKAKDILRIINE